MKKVLTFAMLLLFASSLSLFAQDLDEILESHFEIIGQEKLLDFETISMTGKVMQMGLEMPMKLMQKRPEKMRMEIEFQGMQIVQAYDGEKGWAILPMMGSTEPQDMGEEETKSLKQMADIDGDLYNWEEKGFELSLVGEEDMEGTSVYKLKLVKKDGDIFHYYMDSENFVVLRTDAKVMVNGAEVESSSFFSNFKPVNGMVIPFSIESRMNDQVTAQISIDTVEIDNEIEDSLFQKPVTSEE